MTTFEEAEASWEERRLNSHLLGLEEEPEEEDPDWESLFQHEPPEEPEPPEDV